MAGFASKRQAAWDKFSDPWLGINGWSNVMSKDKALKLALEALEEQKEHFAKHRRLEAITAIKEALAQSEQALDKLFEVENELGLHYDEKPKQDGKEKNS